MASLNGLIDGRLVKDFKDLEPRIQELIKSAQEARKFSYSPYSNFPVGAAILTSTGNIYTGCNIENSSFTPTICAERTAISKAISEGHRNFIACAVVAYKEDQFVFPCGVCRQVFAEFMDQNSDIELYLAKPSSTPLRILCTTVKQIMPFIFKLGTSSSPSSSNDHHNSQSLHLND